MTIKNEYRTTTGGRDDPEEWFVPVTAKAFRIEKKALGRNTSGPAG